ncbi:sortase [Patescibacteria group bacterium]
MAYKYVKAPPPNRTSLKRQIVLTGFFDRLKKLAPTIMITVGASLLISVGYPILSYELTIAKKVKRNTIIAPVPNEVVSANKGILSPTTDPNNPQVLAQTTTSLPSTTVDYTKVSSWFNFSKTQPSFLSPSNITHYTISIPKLRIKDALVTIGGDDLDASLIHYGGTANPGEAGNPVIFGHSVLPQFYNPKSYRSIFSLLPTLTAGDEVIVNFDGITYKYLVYDYFEVSPDEIDILEQRYNKKDITLVTCTPPGTYWRRGIAKAKLVNL